MARGKFRPEAVKKLGDVVLDAKTSRMIRKKIAEAEEELSKEVRINFRWTAEQLKLIQHVARKLGVPYQTYIKQVLYKQAIEDLKSFADSKYLP